jgi:polyisoprenoid-binding protein YceI
MRLALMALSLGLLAAPLAATPYDIDSAHTEIGFETIHLSVAKVRGRFTDYSATIDLNDKDLTKSQVQISINAGSAQTGVERRDGHLKGEDFFNVEKTPNITFKSSSITKNPAGGYLVSGELGIRGVTKTVKLKAVISDAFATDSGGTKRAFSLEGSINRFDYGVGWNKKTKTGSFVVGEQVKLVIDGELDKQKKK